jgi:hypothetical protein
MALFMVTFMTTTNTRIAHRVSPEARVENLDMPFEFPALENRRLQQFTASHFYTNHKPTSITPRFALSRFPHDFYKY